MCSPSWSLNCLLRNYLPDFPTLAKASRLLSKTNVLEELVLCSKNGGHGRIPKSKGAILWGPWWYN
jgi:hypothetical protein